MVANMRDMPYQSLIEAWLAGNVQNSRPALRGDRWPRGCDNGRQARNSSR